MRIFEIDTTQYNPQFNNITNKNFLRNTISRDCSNIVEIMQHYGYLYRGLDKTTLAFKAQTSEHRKPMSSSIEASAAFDNLMKQAKLKATRSNSIFVTSDEARASNFGEVYVVFPRNDCNYTWSPNSKDAIIEFDQTWTRSKIHETAEKLQKTGHITSKENEQLNTILCYRSNEVSMIWQSYIRLPVYHPLRKEFDDMTMFESNYHDSKYFIPDVTVMMHYWEFKTNQIEKAILYQNEIMLNGVYYAIDLYRGGELIEQIMESI